MWDRCPACATPSKAICYTGATSAQHLALGGVRIERIRWESTRCARSRVLQAGARTDAPAIAPFVTTCGSARIYCSSHAILQGFSSLRACLVGEASAASQRNARCTVDASLGLMGASSSPRGIRQAWVTAGSEFPRSISTPPARACGARRPRRILLLAADGHRREARARLAARLPSVSGSAEGCQATTALQQPRRLLARQYRG